MQKSEAGRNFENYVASIYSSLGFTVETNISLSGQQIDILVQKIVPGIGPVKLVIECKSLLQGSVSNQTVFDFASIIAQLNRSENITKGIIVTNSDFSKEAKKAAENNPLVELLTLKKLENSLFDVTTIYKNYVDKYELTDIYKNYIHLSGKGTIGKTFDDRIPDVEKSVIEWIKDPQMSFLTIFGDYGSGKTTLLYRLKYQFAKNYLSGNSTIKPFIILLKDYYEYKDLDILIRHTIQKEFNREIPLELFYTAVNNGEILLLLDGFDEMAQEVDKDKREENFIVLTRLLPANAIITCRPSYFISLSEYEAYIKKVNSANIPTIAKRKVKQKSEDTGKQIYRRLHKNLFERLIDFKELSKIKFTVIRLDQLNSRQIDSYLERHNEDFISIYKMGWEGIKDFLLKIYDIKDLMTRPILLKMIVDTMIFGKVDLTKEIHKIGPSSLYEIYTSFYLEIDWRKGEARQLLLKEERRTFAISIALGMFLKGTLVITYDEILGVVKEYYKDKNLVNKLTSISLEAIATDIQICTFLTTAHDNSFKFSHKSFMEFFVARYLKDYILNDEYTDILDRLLTSEILNYLCNFCLLENNLRTRLLDWHNQKTNWYYLKRSENFKRNICCAILGSASEFEKIKFQEINISFITLNKLHFERCTFKDINFEEATLIDIEFLHTNLVDVHCRKSHFKNCSIYNNTISLNFHDSVLESTRFISNSIVFSSISTRVSKCTFQSANMKFSGNIRFDECVFNECEPKFDLTYQFSGMQFKSSIFNGCQIGSQDTRSIQYNGCIFNGCNFEGLSLSTAHYTGLKFVRCNGYLLIEQLGSEVYYDFKEFGKRDSRNYFRIEELLVIYEPAWRKDKKLIIETVIKYEKDISVSYLNTLL